MNLYIIIIVCILKTVAKNTKTVEKKNIQKFTFEFVTRTPSIIATFYFILYTNPKKAINRLFFKFITGWYHNRVSYFFYSIKHEKVDFIDYSWRSRTFSETKMVLIKTYIITILIVCDENRNI